MSAEHIICDECGFVGAARRKKKRGSGLAERFIWIAFFFPGIFYSLWRRADRGMVCPKCGSKALTPFDTPEGQALLKRQVAERAVSKKSD